MNPLAVAPGTVVSLQIKLYDAQGVLLEEPREPLTYLHGGYGGLLEALERALDGHNPGDVVLAQLEPDQAFGDYDPDLLRIEPVERYGEGLGIGMEIEDDFGGGEPRVYTVTDVAEGQAVLDGNHPLAGMALRFACTVLGVRQASEEELRRGRPDSPIIS